MPEKLLSFGIGKANAMSEGYTLFTVLIGTCSRTELQNGNPDSGSASRLDLKIENTMIYLFHFAFGVHDV